MAIDPKRLLNDSRSLQKARRSRKGSGTTAAVRAALPTIYRLRAEGVLWSEIAEALGQQGVVQGKGTDRIPLTTTRLTALVRQIESHIQNTVQASKKPSTKPQQIKESAALKRRAVSLAVELNPDVEKSNRRSVSSEEELRRTALDRIQDVLKKD